jgi:ABC-2 type transport system permease protein
MKSLNKYLLMFLVVVFGFSTFLCGVYIPLSLLPNSLQFISIFNPMTHAASFFRTLSLEKMSLSTDQLIAEQLAFKISDFVITPQVSMLIVVTFGLVFLLLSTVVFSKVDFSRIQRSKGAKDIYQQ